MNPNLTQESSGETSRTSEESGTPGVPRISALKHQDQGHQRPGPAITESTPSDRTSRGRARTSQHPMLLLRKQGTDEKGCCEHTSPTRH